MRAQFDQAMARLRAELRQMGELCEQAIDQAAGALLRGDTALTQQTEQTEQAIDQAERDIEALCLRLLLRQQPVARDLRQISAALKMITDLERIGDQACDIAELALPLAARGTVPLPHIADMAQAAGGMVYDSVDAYVRQDLDLARAVRRRDDVVDSLFLQVRQELTARIAARPACGEEALDLLMAAKYLERVGDHATNLAEWVEFSITGQHPQGNQGMTTGGAE